MSDLDLNFEAAYWGNCTNSIDEEIKQFVYARFMRIVRTHYSFDIGGKNIVDIGGGPVSMLLKCTNRGPRCTVVDPLMGRFPQWVRDRYACAKISAVNGQGEYVRPRRTHEYDLDLSTFDETWIYNCLQHVEYPARIIQNALDVSPVLRIFEWTDIEPHEGHPHMLTSATLREWIAKAGADPGVFGTVELNESGCVGKAFWGIFRRGH